MRWYIGPLAVLSLLVAAGFRSAAEELSPPRELPIPAVTLSEPVTHANLTIFLLHGKNTLPADYKFLTLQEALEQKKIVVHETSDVNELSIENVSDDVDVFIQSCDIVKGGKQDRIMARDMLLSPGSGKTPILAFCCEAGRWQKRGAESVSAFGSSVTAVGNTSLKTAVNSNAVLELALTNAATQTSNLDAKSKSGLGSLSPSGQAKVWEEVGKAQRQLSEKTGKEVTRNPSPSSYQLSLESKDVQEKIDAYVKALDKSIEGKTDAVGMAIVVNGKVRSIDLYGSHALMAKLWGKLLKGAAIDALSELEKDKSFATATSKDVEQYLARAELGRWSELKMPEGRRGQNGRQAPNLPPQNAPAMKDDPKPPRVRVMHCETDAILLLEAQDTLSNNRMVHRCYLTK